VFSHYDARINFFIDIDAAVVVLAVHLRLYKGHFQFWPFTPVQKAAQKSSEQHYKIPATCMLSPNHAI